jgi:Uma2 family endonuclease
MELNTKLYTVKEFETIEALPENRDRLLELIHGSIVEKMPTELHGIAQGKLFRFLDEFIEENDIAGYVGVEVRHQVAEDDYNSRLPDVSVRLTSGDVVAKGAVQQMPDIAVEVQSPDDSVESLRARIEYYLQNGTRLGWILYPAAQTAEACTLVNGRLLIQAIAADGVLDGGTVLPGFILPVARLFPKKKS